MAHALVFLASSTTSRILNNLVDLRGRRPRPREHFRVDYSNSFAHPLQFPFESGYDFDDALRPNRLKRVDNFWWKDAQSLPLPPPTVRVPLDLRLRCENGRLVKSLNSSVI